MVEDMESEYLYKNLLKNYSQNILIIYHTRNGERHAHRLHDKDTVFL